MVRADTVVAALPMQELALDEWLLRRLGSVDILEAGIPCSGASKAGRAKRALTRMEDHPNVGHLIGATLQLIARLQPAVVLIENVESYRHTASAVILRGWLRDAGYAITEAVLDAADFGSLEAACWFRWLAAALQFNLEMPAPEPPRAAGVLADVLDDRPGRRAVSGGRLPEDQGRTRRGRGQRFCDAVPGLRTTAPTLRKGYHREDPPIPDCCVR
jgi:DNA (cytosine-5)-methyltransferase 1